MTEEQKKKLVEIGKEVKTVFSTDFHGSVRFNLHPNKRSVNMNIEQSLIEKTE